MKKKDFLFRSVWLWIALLGSLATSQAQTTAFSQDFTAIGESTTPADYGFTLTYGAGSSSDLVKYSVTSGVLQCVAGPYASSDAGARTGTATATFDAIDGNNEVTVSYVWALGNATGNATGSYTKTRIGNGSGNALELTFYGSSDGGKLTVNGTAVQTSTDIRNTTYTVTATLNMNTKSITALTMTCSNNKYSYNATEPISFASAITTVDRFAFENAERQSWANTSSIDNVLITYEEIENPDAIEEIASVAITGADKMTFGPTPDEAYSNAYSVVITGVNGSTITENNLNAKVTDFKVVWDVEGFKTENDTEGQYCDSYGAFSVNNQGKVATTFDLRNVPMNFFGKLTATITYNGGTFKAEKYVIAQGNTNKPAAQVLPLAGYPVNLSDYPAALVGYNVTKEAFGTAQDLILGGWCVAGSDNITGVLSADQDGTRYVRITGPTVKKSHVMTKTIKAPTSQVIFVTKLRFNNAGAVVTLTSGYPFWSNSKYTNPVTLSFDGSKLTLNGNVLKNGEDNAAITTGTWYQVVLSIDKTTEQCYAMVYNAQGTLLGQSGIVAWNETSNPTYFSIGMGNSNSGSVDLASYEAFTPAISNYTLIADKETLSIPNKETATLTATALDANGYAITQQATWSVVEEDMRESVIITPNQSDSHVATVSLADNAEAGTATVQVSIGGSTKTLALTLTSSSESIKFTQSTTSVTIPMDAAGTATATFAAAVVDGEGNDTGSNVTLAVYDKDNTTPLAALPAGVTFDAQTGVLTVKGTASPVQLTIRATGKNSDSEELTKAVRVNIHGMKFDFGFADEDALAEGFTLVSPSTGYTTVSGYGIVSGSATAGGSASADNADSDYLEGALQFDFKATKGDFYSVEITYQGKLTTGYVNSDLAGYELGTHESMTTETYTIPATLERIDLHVADATSVARIAKVVITKQAKRTKRGKRVVHHIGDSTSANNGSWAYRLSGLSGTYPKLFALCNFQNNGAGGRNLSTYYTQGKLANVLLDIYPDDVVMFGNNGTNGMGNSFEADMNYYLDAAEALGAQVIINSYTPHGAVNNYSNGYNSSTHTFDSYRKDSYETIVRKVAAERAASDENYLGFVEIGKNADAIFNAYVADYTANDYASADDAAQAIISCFTDHNHYNKGTLACDLMLGGYSEVKGIVEQLIDLLGTPNQKTISAWGWNTYSSQLPVTFGSNVQAYIVTSANASTVTLSPVTTIPAYTGVLLNGTAGEQADITVANGVADAVTENLLAETASGAVTLRNGYVLSATAEEGSLGFYNVASFPKTVARYSAYLPAGAVSAGAREMLRFLFDDGQTTGITQCEPVSETRGQFYTLSGMRVQHPNRGLYIVNGKKVIIGSSVQVRATQDNK